MSARGIALLSGVILLLWGSSTSAQGTPAAQERLAGTQSLPRVAVIGLPELLTDRVIEHLALGKRFLPVERKALAAALSEQRFGRPPRQTYLDRTLDKAIKDMDKLEEGTIWATGMLSAHNDLLKQVADLGTAVGAHYLVLGHVEKLTQTAETAAVPYAPGRTMARGVSEARVRLRIVDVKTSTVVGARSLRAAVSDDWFAGKAADRDTLAFLDDVGRLAAAAVLDVAFPARIIKLEPMVLSRGSNDGVQKGDRYDILREGEGIRGETGAVIGRLKTSVGQVEVLEAQENIALVKPVAGRDFKVRDLAAAISSRGGDSQGAREAREAREPQPPPLRRGEAEVQLPRIAIGLMRSGSTAAEERKNIAVFTDTIISRLAQTKRFRVMDRQEVEQLLTEQLAQALEQNRGLKSAMGTLKGADYLAYGSVSVFVLEKEVVKLPHSSRTFEQQVGRVEGNVRIVEARSGEIKESRKVAVRKDLEAGGEKSRLVTNLADAFAEEVVSVLMQAIYPIKVVAVAPDGTIYVNRGADGGLSAGERLSAYRPGRTIVDPDTGARLGTEESEVGEVVLREVEDARSKAAATGGGGLRVGDVLKRGPGGRSRATVAPVGPERSEAGRAAPDGKLGGKGRATLAVGTFRIAPGGRTEALTSEQLSTLTNELIVKLTNTNRFEVMDRQEVDQVLDEKAFRAASSGTNIKESLRQLEGADYVILGEISRFSLATQRARVPYVEETQTRTTGIAEATVRVVDAGRGAVVAAEKIQVSERLVEGADKPADTLSLVDRFTTVTVSRLLDRVFPTAVIGVQPDGTVYINRGADGNLQIGAVFEVMRPGKELKDPQTGLSFGLSESKIGVIEVMAVEASRSRGRMLSGQTPAVGDVLRLASEAEAKKRPGEPKVMRPSF
jgi:curli biogenesis system outer membrane secretion channel CsgG